ncbi:MAG: ATP-binding protein, partial [Spirochaetota bacterium]
ELELEQQYRQAQKMEAVGRLAGGVAHDFNNMLSVILGHAELELMRSGLSGHVRESLMEIQKAAENSAQLTRQLLAFARRQTVEPRVLDLNETVEGILKMLRRLMGEDIELAWLPGAGLWAVKVDPAQVDQVLANLCVNARDAIKGVGKVTIETGNAVFDEGYCRVHAESRPGEYVMLGVSDTGCGMDRETREHLFEPFFTTKGVGEGTGLGLATVYGIVKQNEGFINVYSEPGQGTIFRIYFPRCTGAQETEDAKGGEGVPRGSGETVLLVEDEPAILELGRVMLEQLGYRVVAAGTPDEALERAGVQEEDIRLLVTDVVMPHMNGRELAERLRERRPGLKCLFLSGYTADIIARHGVLEEGVHFIQKPFTMTELAMQVRAALGEERPG